MAGVIRTFLGWVVKSVWYGSNKGAGALESAIARWKANRAGGHDGAHESGSHHVDPAGAGGAHTTSEHPTATDAPKTSGPPTFEQIQAMPEYSARESALMGLFDHEAAYIRTAEFARKIKPAATARKPDRKKELLVDAKKASRGSVPEGARESFRSVVVPLLILGKSPAEIESAIAHSATLGAVKTSDVGFLTTVFRRVLPRIAFSLGNKSVTYRIETRKLPRAAAWVGRVAGTALLRRKLAKGAGIPPKKVRLRSPTPTGPPAGAASARQSIFSRLRNRLRRPRP